MKIDNEKEDWQNLCKLVADESDPQRLSELVEQLIQALDARRQELKRSEQERNRFPTPGQYEA